MIIAASSDDDHTTLAIWMCSRHATFTYIGGHQLFIESVCVWVVDVIVDTCLEVEARWLPELLHVAASMVKV